MKLNLIKYATIAFSLAVFIISLNADAVTIDFNEIKTVPSLDYFLMGSTAFLGGGFFEQLIWLANPLCLIAMFLLLGNSKITLVFSSVAFVLAVSFSTWNKILGAESGAMAQIVSLERGYYLWILSIFILNVGAYIYFKAGGSEFKPKYKLPKAGF
jgi:hypothetical protein